MPDQNVMFFSFPSDYSSKEKELIMDAFRMGNIETIEKKGFGEFMDLILAAPEMVVIAFDSGESATAIFEKFSRENYETVKKKLIEGLSGRQKAKTQFIIELSHTKLKVAVNLKQEDQLYFGFKNLNELIRQYQNDGSAKEFGEVNCKIKDNQWEQIKPSQTKGGFGPDDYGAGYVFPVDDPDNELQYKILRQAAIIGNPYHTAIISMNDKEEFDKMLELRKRVYVDELHWVKEHRFYENEQDYDNEYAQYIIVYDENNNQVGSLRILKPESRWMIEKEFKVLLNGAEINKTASIEITRLLISTKKRHLRESMQASACLFRGIYQWMKANRFSTLYMVVRPEYFKFFEMEGLRPLLIGIDDPDEPKFDHAVAGKIDLATTMSYLKKYRYELWQWITKKDDPPKR